MVLGMLKDVCAVATGLALVKVGEVLTKAGHRVGSSVLDDETAELIASEVGQVVSRDAREYLDELAPRVAAWPEPTTRTALRGSLAARRSAV